MASPHLEIRPDQSTLLKAREAIEKQIDDLDRKVLKLARHDAQNPQIHDCAWRRANHGTLLKSDRNDAAGIARIMQTGWFKKVRVKDLDCHAVKALLTSRALLVKIKRVAHNTDRGLL